MVARQPRVALVHDALINTGGAERVVSIMHEAFPEAPIFTSAYLPAQTFAEFRSAEVKTLPGSHLVRTERRAKQLFFWWVLGFSRLAFDEFDIVLSSTTWGAKFIRPGPRVRHACYCYAPFRLLWQPDAYSRESLPVHRLAGGFVNLARAPLRQWDYQVTQRPERLATTCGNMARQIKTAYGREARIIYAPIRMREYHLAAEAGDYYLVVSRLISHKRVDLAIDACQALGRKLVVVGDGPERARLERLGCGEVRFMGRISEPDLKELYARCRAVIFPSNEDFGLVPLEAQASGRPVIAYGAGGALETVLESQTGVFFRQQSTPAVMAAIEAFERLRFDPRSLRQAVQRFDSENFKGELREFVLYS